MRWSALLLLGLTGGCSSFFQRLESTKNGFTRATLRHEYRAAIKAYDQAVKTGAHEDYVRLATLCENLNDRYPPDSPQKEEVLFWQAKAQLALKNYHDAEETSKDYLKLYAKGSHQEEMAQDLVRIKAEQAAPSAAAEERLQASKKNLEQLLALEREYPGDPRIKYYLGNIYYDLEKYKEAGRYYYEAQALEAAYKEKELIKERLAINAKGEPIALAPSAARQAETDRNPLVIFDQTNYYQRDNTDAFSARQVFANVTGKVRNQGSRPARNVEIEVRFLNATNDILDFQTIPIGTLHPGEVRPFLAQASHYNDILNVTRVETFAREGR